VPEREQTKPPYRPPFAWLRSIFQYHDREIIKKCGLDAYFFLRYLQTLLIIFVPLALLLIPILVPINYIGGKGTVTVDPTSSTNATYNVTGLDVVAWSNVAPKNVNRYWAHLVLAVIVVLWVCGVFFAELRVYIRVRQDYLTSAEHRLRASATTVLVSAIPEKWLTITALEGLYDVFPGGIRNIWINRNYDKLLEKVHAREAILYKLEDAETNLIKACKKAQLKQKKKDDKKISKEEKERQDAEADAEAKRLAEGQGVSSGDPQDTNRTVDEAVEDAQYGEDFDAETETRRAGRFKVSNFGNPLAAVGQGIGKGFEAVGNTFGKAGGGLVGGVKTVGQEFGNTLQTTNGFTNISSPPEKNASTFPSRDTKKKPSGQLQERENMDDSTLRDGDAAPRRNVAFGQSPALSSPEYDQFSQHRRSGSQVSLQDGATDSFERDKPVIDPNRTIQHANGWKFWEGPSGGYPSPLPHGYEDGDEFPLNPANNNGNLDKKDSSSSGPKSFISSLFGSRSKEKEVDKTDTHNGPHYGEAFNKNLKEDGEDAAWRKYIKAKHRPTHTVPKAGWRAWPAMLHLPFTRDKVDTIYWCREQLATLNLEIEHDQEHPEEFPLMNSAFIQFNHQVAAHMAAQSVSHHVPRHMAPRAVEISPSDVIWDNMSIKWWESWLRTGFVIAIVTGMIILWAFPVSATALLANIPALVIQFPFLKFLQDNTIILNFLQSIGGILPALVLAILLILVPIIFYFLANLQGAQTGMARDLSVQNFYFFFLFVQVFLVVSIASGTLATLQATANDITSIPQLLANNLPKASNYFFSYMILQALSTSVGNLVQWVTLITWFVLPRLVDSTARAKWRRNTTLSTVNWGSYFPTYTNFACIALIYCVVAPLILVFAIITFTLLWISNRYTMLYVNKVKEDTGGLLYPRAINQTFTGLYVMELCLIGLFFLVQDENQKSAAIPQAIIMIVVAALTVLYQILLDQAFSPLYRYLPITFEDEAVARDEAFARAQDIRFGDHDDDGELDEYPHDGDQNKAIEMKRMSRSETNPASRFRHFDPRHAATAGVNWASRGAKNVQSMTFKRGPGPRRRKDLEAQRKLNKALFDFEDEIEDLDPEARDVLVKRAFHHEAIRSRKPTVWIPRDDLGVSDDEIRRTAAYSEGNIWISNEGTALDSKVRVVYGRNPPDFSNVDMIKL
jgi:hypothetical protein